ncbi:rod shape-determining protein MreC [Candidatus Tachikawaea gelatinosa]|uniref:Cell shape-determining protein MreC n=1 Tax=Candidatus Tachikawaea gelatinosa TaxID=1410383 RepID=A0A090AS55_9ENTR|nr:rod shape-determining protein MreC [Candidatus Tachikawaea gelatinosa]BAP58690.1 rod shape-determining protein MreC [Candidatus Tachikawaea gelatinosa]
MKLFFNKKFLSKSYFFTLLVITLILILLDIRFGLLFKTKCYINQLISPILCIKKNFKEKFSKFSKYLISNEKLQSEIDTLYQELMLKNHNILILNNYKKENNQLRQLLDAPVQLKNLHHPKIFAQVLSFIINDKKNYIMINKGSDSGIYKGQPVFNGLGIVGQVRYVDKKTSNVALIFDKSHALPVKIARNNLHAIIYGNGLNQHLSLRYFPEVRTIDAKVGDLIVTSGLDEIFPPGYPVAFISSIKKDLENINALSIKAQPIFGINKISYVLL